MSELKELISYLQKVDEKYPNNTVDHVNISLTTINNEYIRICLDVPIFNNNSYSIHVTKKLKDL